jgi:hypothetical protein
MFFASRSTAVALFIHEPILKHQDASCHIPRTDAAMRPHIRNPEHRVPPTSVPAFILLDCALNRDIKTTGPGNK